MGQTILKLIRSSFLDSHTTKGVSGEIDATPWENVLPCKQMGQVVLRTPCVQSAFVTGCAGACGAGRDASDTDTDPERLVSPTAL